MDRAALFVTRYGRWLALCMVVSVVVPVSVLPEARIDNSIEVWLGRDGKAYREYRDFLKRFGNEEFVVIAAEADDPLGDEALAAQRKVAEAIRSIDQVDTVLSLSSLADGLSHVRGDWKSYLAESDFTRNLLIGKNGRTFGIVVWLKPIEAPALRRATVEQIESTVRGSDLAAYGVHLAGTPLMNVALDRGSQQASRTFLPVALLVSVVILALTLRSVSGVIAVIASVAVTTLWTVGLLVATGKAFNMVTVTLPSLLFVLSLSGGIHIASRFLALHAACGQRADAMRQTLKEVSGPILLSGITTAVGFASLMISDMRPVVDFGIFAAVGILLSVVINLLVPPGVLMLLPIRPCASRAASSHWTARIGVRMANSYKLVIALSVGTLIFCIGWTTQARVESNVLKFFPSTSTISRDYDYIRRNLTGFYTVELEFTTDVQNGRHLMARVNELAEAFSNEPDVAKVIHYGSLAAFAGMVQQHTLVMPAQVHDNPLRTMMDRFRVKTDDQVHLRMSVFINAMSSKQFYPLLDRIDAAVRKTVDAQTRYTITGVVPLLNAAQQSLVDTQIKSFSLALAVVLAMIAVFMRSVRAVAAAVLPNILPIFALFCIMAIAGIAIDAATVMIASIAIGIAVDDTIHFLSHFRTRRLAGAAIDPAIRQTLAGIGPAVTLTSVVATAGFLILCLAQFSPIRYFGLLAAVTMVTAWVGDVVILPACVASLKLWAGKKGGTDHA